MKYIIGSAAQTSCEINAPKAAVLIALVDGIFFPNRTYSSGGGLKQIQTRCNNTAYCKSNILGGEGEKSRLYFFLVQIHNILPGKSRAAP